MVEHTQVARSKRIQRRTGKTFHVATRLLPKRIRHATYVLYGFFRIADEVVDAEDTGPPAEQRAELDRLRRAALGEEPTDDPVLEAFAEVKAEHGIADEDVRSFVDAMESDIDTDRYETYEELETYMDGSAAAVGRMMTAIMDLDEETEAAALPHATKLGEAFQMTNFIRDVREDVVERGRVYLPLETLRRHDVSEEQILELEFDADVAAAVREELARTERLYEEGVAGIKYLPEDCQLAVLLAAVLYADHHRLIRDLGYDTVSTTPELSFARKISLLVRTRWKWQWNKDPEAVFYEMCRGFDGTRDHREHGPHGSGVAQSD
ncbi:MULTISPECIES: phytoene/squalene synthase family protein [unclassified Halorubrum]|uniref:phytoene/squalene synthase family protein n=1 Tax=unclassified Halorubrum TaxID=2642239 RepID=UPI000B992716|nr:MULTISPECIES: phytoene/squalene synthase family protein [unclassified Halorubrum]OYR49188.1 geranylgeranyl-diphosphate geranylgeranyltransferase [Halorubrum sp. Ea8]OYR50390.1 geranylgeranyl-diphosphate geranylgeranyltransferase [Halorubrum sp. Eb13]OYR53527.1 geranylgeranyl-diphosphate geranylgeranyltransferase [Halorubrum sp. Ea1]